QCRHHLERGSEVASGCYAASSFASVPQRQPARHGDDLAGVRPPRGPPSSLEWPNPTAALVSTTTEASRFASGNPPHTSYGTRRRFTMSKTGHRAGVLCWAGRARGLAALRIGAGGLATLREDAGGLDALRVDAGAMSSTGCLLRTVGWAGL